MATVVSGLETAVETAATDRAGSGATCFFDQIRTPGCYVERRSGALLRIPPDALTSEGGPSLEILGNARWSMTKISDDPFIPRTRARLIAANMDLWTDF